MKDSGIPDERLAALLDGRLDERERAELLARLAQSDDDYEVLADTAAVLGDLESAGVERPRMPETAARAEPGEAERPGERNVIPLRPRPARGWHGSGARWGALAAVLAAVALAAVLWSRLGSTDPGDPARLAALLHAGDARLQEGWTDDHPWRRTRGPGDALTDQARAARLGALLVDLELAVATRDTPLVAPLAERIAALLEDLSAGSAEAMYHEISRRSAESPERLKPLLEQGREDVADLAGEDFVGLGAWVEAARLAAAVPDEGFFRTRETRAALERAVALLAPGPARDSLERTRRAVRGDGTPRWEEVRGELDRLLYALAS